MYKQWVGSRGSTGLAEGCRHAFTRFAASTVVAPHVRCVALHYSDILCILMLVLSGWQKLYQLVIQPLNVGCGAAVSDWKRCSMRRRSGTEQDAFA